MRFLFLEILGYIYIYLEIRYSYVENYNKTVRWIPTLLCAVQQPGCVLRYNVPAVTTQKNIFCAKILRSQFWVGFLKSVRYNNHKKEFF